MKKPLLIADLLQVGNAVAVGVARELFASVVLGLKWRGRRAVA